jgi:hypothetical protein
MAKLTEKNIQEDAPMLHSVGLLSPTMNSVQLNHWAFTVATDPVVKERCGFCIDVAKWPKREAFESEKEFEDGIMTATYGDREPIDVVREMTPSEINELQKRVIAREARRTHPFEMV